MKPCDLDTGAARIWRGYEELQLAWSDAKEEWSDPVSRAVEEQHLEPMAPVIKATLDAVARMRTLLHEAQRDLDDPTIEAGGSGSRRRR